MVEAMSSTMSSHVLMGSALILLTTAAILVVAAAILTVVSFLLLSAAFSDGLSTENVHFVEVLMPFLERISPYGRRTESQQETSENDKDFPQNKNNIDNEEEKIDLTESEACRERFIRRWINSAATEKTAASDVTDVEGEADQPGASSSYRYNRDEIFQTESVVGSLPDEIPNSQDEEIDTSSRGSTYRRDQMRENHRLSQESLRSKSTKGKVYQKSSRSGGNAGNGRGNGQGNSRRAGNWKRQKVGTDCATHRSFWKRMACEASKTAETVLKQFHDQYVKVTN